MRTTSWRFWVLNHTHQRKRSRRSEPQRPYRVPSLVAPIVTLTVTLTEAVGRVSLGTREFWPDCHRGGMAEWSMAVVLKTSRVGYTKTVIFSRPTSPEQDRKSTRLNSSHVAIS